MDSRAAEMTELNNSLLGDFNENMFNGLFNTDERINKMKKIVFIIIFLILSISFFGAQVKTEEVGKLDITVIEKEIFNLVNAEREKMGLNELRYDEKLADVARIHSRNMIEQDFFSHEDPERRGPQERVETYYPEIISRGFGENIGFTHGENEEAVATNLMESWMGSPEHRANILSNQFSHIGVGVKQDGLRYFATQKFITAVVRVPEDTAKEVEFGSEVTLQFEFAGTFDRDDLTVYSQFPNKSARYYISENQFYTGKAPLTPEWIDEKTFSVTFKFDKGKGDYTFHFGQDEHFYPRGYTVVAN
jgi:uncharacterized protein YkwD